MEPNMSLEMELLAELRAALTEHVIRSDLRKDVSGLAVKTHVPGVYVWVFVGFTSMYFSWDGANQQHPVSDIPGAARRIAAHVKGLRLLDGGA
jgi:hypothetical protein